MTNMNYKFETIPSEVDPNLYHFRVYDSLGNFVMSQYDTLKNIETEKQYWVQKGGDIR